MFMNCQNHPELPAVAFCRSCGKPLCQSCQRNAQGTVFCEEHMPAVTAAPGLDSPGPAAGSPWTVPSTAAPATPDGGVSPGLAFVLGLIPGVGAIYNGQYAKGLIHVVVLGLLISIISSGAVGGLEPLFGFLIPLWFFYMAFEAYHTAKRRQLGLPVDEFSSIMPAQSAGFPIAPVLLIALGVLFLLNNLEIIRFYQIVRYWPVFLIGLGIYLLYVRMSASPAAPPSAVEVNHEQR
jgi:hypothetical protein